MISFCIVLALHVARKKLPLKRNDATKRRNAESGRRRRGKGTEVDAGYDAYTNIPHRYMEYKSPVDMVD